MKEALRMLERSMLRRRKQSASQRHPHNNSLDPRAA